MTTWYGGHGWGWCSVMVDIPVMVAFWGVVFAAMVLAVRFALKRPSDPPAPTGTAATRCEGVVPARGASAERKATTFAAG
jgi:hypothetical protein